jgi:hypothetical protein
MLLDSLRSRDGLMQSNCMFIVKNLSLQIGYLDKVLVYDSNPTWKKNPSPNLGN